MTDPAATGVLRVAREHVADLWPQVADRLAAALAVAGGRWPLWAVLDELLAGHADLWIALHGDGAALGCAVTRPAQYPGRRYLSVHAVAGERMEDWGGPMLEAIEEHARLIGCDGIEAAGRPGWARLAAARGWGAPTVLLAKEFGR